MSLDFDYVVVGAGINGTWYGKYVYSFCWKLGVVNIAQGRVPLGWPRPPHRPPGPVPPAPLQGQLPRTSNYIQRRFPIKTFFLKKTLIFPDPHHPQGLPSAQPPCHDGRCLRSVAQAGKRGRRGAHQASRDDGDFPLIHVQKLKMMPKSINFVGLRWRKRHLDADDPIGHGEGGERQRFPSKALFWVFFTKNTHICLKKP